MKRDHYKILEVSRTASAEEIQHAYRKLALRYHPDRNPAPDAAACMSAINEAWEVLGDLRRRRDYDALLAKPPMNPEYAASIVLAARDVILRSGCRVLEDGGKVMLLEHARQTVRVVFLDRVDPAVLQAVSRRYTEFIVVLSLNVEGPIHSGAPAAAIDLLHSEHHGAPLPDSLRAPGRSPFAAFL